ncbi:MAG: NAD(P)/FAD-dependent oxidoreductase [Gammaproteobacteria bacterium]|nr:NAD(P)/FAD-dependent oxidoreductase [Gammaproteobacteria bacterium]
MEVGAVHAHIAVDVLIVGLGPAGASAAHRAAIGGLNVLGVDKKKEIGSPVQCAEFVPAPMRAYAPPSSAAYVQSIDTMETNLPSGQTVSTDFPGLMLDRVSFDKCLVDKAEKAGARIESDSRLLNLDADRQIATVLLEDQVVAVHFYYLVAADGSNSLVAQFLGLPALTCVQTRQYSVPLLEPCSATHIWLSGEYPGGYAWMFPKGATANLGLGADKAFLDDLKRPLDALHKQLVDQGTVANLVLSRTGGAIPVSGIRERLSVRKIVFVGDAAGLAHPITGAGIASAIQSGELAGDAIVAFANGDKDALADYEMDVRAQYGESLGRAVARRRWLREFWQTSEANNDAIMRKGWIAFDEYFGKEKDFG